jgi:hypothetical protein
MGNPSERFPWLAHQFDALVENLDECASLEERKKVLTRMKVLIEEIDQIIFSTLRRDDAISPSPESREFR